jgi:ABC-type multidrug transport system fused ATPase/permease subunit
MAQRGNRRGRADYSDLPKGKLSFSNIKRSLRIFSYVGKYKLHFAMGMFFLLCSAAVGLLFPTQSGKMIGLVASGVDSAEKLAKLKPLGMLLLGVLACQALFSFCRVYFFSQVTESLVANLRKDAFAKVLTKPMAFFSTQQTAELNSRIATDISVISDTFTITIAEFIRQIVVGVGGLICLIWVTPFALAKWFLFIIPPIVVLSILFAKRIRKYSKDYQDKLAETNVIVGEALTGITNVKTFTNEYLEINNYNYKVNELRLFGIRYGVFRGAFFAFVIACVFGAVFFMLYKMLELNFNGQLNGEQFGQFLMLALFVTGSLAGLPEQVASIQRALGATDRLFELMDEGTEKINEHASANRLSNAHIVFDKVQFFYPSRPEFEVLKSVSFEAQPGQTVALVGSSGSGKSTIASLLLRFYEPNSGSIFLNGTNIAALELTDLRSQIAFVPQEVILFGGTILENIRYGKPDASEQDVQAAAQKANALDFINSFPDKFNTLVGERGIQLSGGQRQRIAIARAVLKDPAILILDEATSSLDSESEHIVQDALDKLMAGRTSIVIAHRLATVRNASKIVVLHKGDIVEQGTHAQLIANADGFYTKLNKMQIEGSHNELSSLKVE